LSCKIQISGKEILVLGKTTVYNEVTGTAGIKNQEICCLKMNNTLEIAG